MAKVTSAPDDDDDRDEAVVHHSIGNLSVGGDFYQNYVWSPAPQPKVDEQRVNFFFSFLNQALKQAETTFRLSVIFMSAGAVILLVGGALALADQHSNYLPALTSLSGLLITSCGGAFAIHSNRARKHLTEQANRLRDEMRSDVLHEQTLALIDRVADANLQDRLKSLAAMRLLGLDPDAGVTINRLMPGDEQASREIEP
ncbi:TRADD-N-associated membrane domain-containing protein [Actinoallomurus soli]|uniref:TRADD-N-associated membrane domain-containing protein n=1 Tax=Actinoallomurus soli TaxID=2952535 RepID=UPI002092A5E5|nr:hypothetical protein [Actinoallomurus soli]MCO5967920.1 hypothetical protein [Actinoallomurus soli]